MADAPRGAPAEASLSYVFGEASELSSRVVAVLSTALRSMLGHGFLSALSVVDRDDRTVWLLTSGAEPAGEIALGAVQFARTAFDVEMTVN